MKKNLTQFVVASYRREDANTQMDIVPAKGWKGYIIETRPIDPSQPYISPATQVTFENCGEAIKFAQAFAGMH